MVHSSIYNGRVEDSMDHSVGLRAPARHSPHLRNNRNPGSLDEPDQTDAFRDRQTRQVNFPASEFTGTMVRHRWTSPEDTPDTGRTPRHSGHNRSFNLPLAAIEFHHAVQKRRIVPPPGSATQQFAVQRQIVQFTFGKQKLHRLTGGGFNRAAEISALEWSHLTRDINSVALNLVMPSFIFLKTEFQEYLLARDER
jgi:hypothetical protein